MTPSARKTASGAHTRRPLGPEYAEAERRLLALFRQMWCEACEDDELRIEFGGPHHVRLKPRYRHHPETES